MAALTLRPLQRVRILETAAYCSRGGTGRRVRLRTVWGNPWRFESSREHVGYFKDDVPLSLLARGSSSRRPSGFHQLGKPPPPRSGESALFFDCGSSAHFRSRLLSSPASSGGSRQLGASGRRNSS